MGCHAILQGIFLIQELNLRLLHWQVDSLLLSHQGSPLKAFWGRKLEGFLKVALIWVEEEECWPGSPGEQNQDLRRSCLLLNWQRGWGLGFRVETTVGTEITIQK